MPFATEEQSSVYPPYMESNLPLNVFRCLKRRTWWQPATLGTAGTSPWLSSSGEGCPWKRYNTIWCRCKPTHLTSVFSQQTSIFTLPHGTMLTAFADVCTDVAGCYIGWFTPTLNRQNTRDGNNCICYLGFIWLCNEGSSTWYSLPQKRTFAKYVEPKEGSIEIDENGN